MIRYKINIMEVLKMAGFSTYRLRNEKKFSESTMQKFRTGDTTISVASLNDVCNLLKCQPGDLLEFVPDE